jgi:hypothetical protein
MWKKYRNITNGKSLVFNNFTKLIVNYFTYVELFSRINYSYFIIYYGINNIVVHNNQRDLNKNNDVDIVVYFIELKSKFRFDLLFRYLKKNHLQFTSGEAWVLDLGW